MTSNEPPILPPAIVMLGCRPWSAERAKPGECPVCGKGVKPGHDRYCAFCDSVEPAKQARIDRARRRWVVSNRIDKATTEFRASLQKKLRGAAELSESDRRRYWMGSKMRPNDVVNARRECRDWLRSIGQVPEPDFVATCDL